MEPSDYLAALRKRWWVVLLCAALLGAAGYGYAAREPAQYRATSSAFVSVSRGDTVSELVQGSTFSQALVQSYARLAQLPVVLDPVIDELALDTTPRALARSVSAEASLDTVIIEISAVSTSPDEAQAIANAVLRQLATAVGDVSPRASDGSDAVRLTTVAEASRPSAPFAPNVRTSTAAGIALGLALGVALALLRELTDTKVRNARDVQRVTPAPLLGAIGVEPRSRKAPVMRDAPTSGLAESYRRLRANLDYLRVESRLQSIVVTSAVPGEGKSTTALNLALAMAEGGARVLLVDADLRRPSIARVTGLEGAAGLTTVLIGAATAQDVTQVWGPSNLHVMTSGGIPPNPSQLLSSTAMERLLEQLVEAYDLVILDVAPLVPVADPAIVARLTDGALVVAGCRRVRRPQLAEAMTALETAGARCLGVVLNRVARSADGTRDGYLATTGHRRGWRRRPGGRRVAERPEHGVVPVRGGAVAAIDVPALDAPAPDAPVAVARTAGDPADRATGGPVAAPAADVPAASALDAATPGTGGTAPAAAPVRDQPADDATGDAGLTDADALGTDAPAPDARTAGATTADDLDPAGPRVPAPRTDGTATADGAPVDPAPDDAPADAPTDDRPAAEDDPSAVRERVVVDS